jgi:hypothetical protein
MSSALYGWPGAISRGVEDWLASLAGADAADATGLGDRSGDRVGGVVQATSIGIATSAVITGRRARVMACG